MKIRVLLLVILSCLFGLACEEKESYGIYQGQLWYYKWARKLPSDPWSMVGACRVGSCNETAAMFRVGGKLVNGCSYHWDTGEFQFCPSRIWEAGGPVGTANGQLGPIPYAPL